MSPGSTSSARSYERTASRKLLRRNWAMPRSTQACLFFGSIFTMRSHTLTMSS